MRVPLLTAAGVLAAIHVIGVLFARPLFRPAEVLALLCLLLCCRTWALRTALAALVLGAALTVPPPATDGAGLQILSPEQYDGLVQQARLESLIPMAATLLFILIVLATTARGSRPHLAAVVAGTVLSALVVAYVAVRAVVVTAAADPGALNAAGLVPLLVALAAVALTVVLMTRRQWPATIGAILLAALAVIWIDGALSAIETSYAVRDAAMLFSLNLITPTETLPQPTQALTATLQLTAALLITTTLTRPTPPPNQSVTPPPN